jgi:Tfp pilus assembly protein PilN
VGLFALVAAPIAVTSVHQTRTVTALSEAVTDAKSESTRLKPEIERIHRLNQQTQELNHRIGVVEKLGEAGTYYVQVLDDISQILPRHMWLVRLEEDGSRPGIATIEGYTFTNLYVADLMVRLEKLGHFEDVVLVKIERESVEGRDVLQFELEVRLTYDVEKEGQREHP